MDVVKLLPEWNDPADDVTLSGLAICPTCYVVFRWEAGSTLVTVFGLLDAAMSPEKPIPWECPACRARRSQVKGQQQ